jgi:hypothetical protein
MRKIPATPILAVLPSPSNELQASRAMPPDVREFLIAKLAEILVLDYQQNQEVMRPTVTKTSGFNRTLKLVGPEENAG